MSALPTGPALAAKQASKQPKARGFLHIVRHGAGVNAFYIVTYHRLDRVGARPKAMLAEGAQALIEMLEKGTDLRNAPRLEGTAGIKERLVTALNELKRDWEKRESKLEQARF